MFRLALKFSVLAALLAGYQQAYGDIGEVIWNEYSESPSIIIPQSALGPAKDIPNPIYTSINCYDEGSGALLDCPFTFELDGVDLGNDPQVAGQLIPLSHIEIYGGHEHDFDTHPFYETFGTQYPIQVTGGTFTRTGPLSVSGRTANNWVTMTFNAPETAGSVWTEIDVGSPPTYHCSGVCFTFTDSLEHDTTLIGFFGLQQLPASGTDYAVNRNPDSAHPDSVADWGTPYAIKQVQGVAHQYHKFAGILLSVNDMSLEEGGLFDALADNQTASGASGTWTIPHRDHRTGNAFDINHGIDSNGDKIPCKESYNVQIAVIEANYDLTGTANLKTPVQFVCEPNGNIHINAFDPSLSTQIHE